MFICLKQSFALENGSWSQYLQTLVSNASVARYFSVRLLLVDAAPVAVPLTLPVALSLADVAVFEEALRSAGVLRPAAREALPLRGKESVASRLQRAAATEAALRLGTSRLFVVDSMSVGGGEREPRELKIENGRALVSRLSYGTRERYRKKTRKGRDEEFKKKRESRESRNTDDGFGSDGDKRSPR